MKSFSKNTAKALVLGVALAITPMYSIPVCSASSLDDQIAEQERLLAELNQKKKKVNTSELKDKISGLESEIKELSKKDTYDSKKAIDRLSSQLEDLRKQLDAQAKTQELLMETIKRLDKLMEEQRTEKATYEEEPRMVNTSWNRLVNPAPMGEVSYTQDAQNAQNNSTMVFHYAPDQLYKIYCRVGYLTDIELHKGESVNFVGGGDTSAWAINNSVVNGYPHIYIKPVVETSTTNIIITTDKRSYQLICTTSDWYNPMVRWTYGQEEAQERAFKKAKDERTIIDKFGVTDINKLHFNYSVSVKGNEDFKPQMVMDDGEKTVIRFNRHPDRIPALFIREVGSRKVTLCNFKTRQNAFVIDRVVDRAELRFSDADIVTIVRGR